MGPVEPESSEAYVLSVTRGASCWGRVCGRLGRLRKPDLTPPRKARQLYKTKAVTTVAQSSESVFLFLAHLNTHKNAI